MASFFPPLQITVSGNKCGGCCKSTRVRGEEAPLHYVVYHVAGTSNLVAAPAQKMQSEREAEIARLVFEHVKNYLKNAYEVDWDDIPITARPINLTKAPSVATIKTVEAAAQGFCEGVKRGKSSTASIPTPKMHRDCSSGGSE